MTTKLSRRRFLNLVGWAGGVAAVYRTAAAMGLLPIPTAYAGPPALPAGSGQGVRVAVIGAGIAGMVAAYELGKAGYECRVLEARTRPGGRNWSLRGGDVVEETDSRQAVAWETGPHMYFNPGPGRIPHHHQGIISYCRTLGVPLEIMMNDNRGAWFHDDAVFAGKPVPMRQAVNDARGFVAELAAKGVDRGALDDAFAPEDRERLRGFLRNFGALGRDGAYRGSPRAGYAEPPAGGLEEGRILAPLDMHQLLASEFWWRLNFGEGYEFAATMLQPEGGMGRIGEAFGRALGDVVTYNAEVRQLRRTDSGASLIWRDRTNGKEEALAADYVLCTVPFPALRGLDADFSPEVRAAMAAVDYVAAGKVAFEARRRFWEEDEAIYGGITWTSRDITQIWYPSAGLHAAKGILVGAYIWSQDIGAPFTAKPPAERIDAALADGARIHPAYAESLANGVAVAWAKIPFTMGAWAEWSRKARADAYPLLLKPDGAVYFAGEHMSHITGWQEGAVRSAHVAIAAIAKRVQARKT